MTIPTCHCEKRSDEARLLNIVGQGSGQAISEIAALTTFAAMTTSTFLKKEVENYVK